MKSYFRYAPEHSLGVINSPECNAVYDFTGKIAFTGALQSIGMWNLRQGSQIRALDYDKVNYPYGDYGDVVCLVRSPDKVTLAAGYSTGEIRIFNYLTGSIQATYRGHKSSITSLAYDEDGVGGMWLASGSADCSVIVWDVVANSGIVRYFEHKDAVTSLAFVTVDDRKLLLTASKDTLLKVWDMDTRHCVQTIVGHRSEIWSLAVVRHADQNQLQDIHIYTGAADELVRGYRLKRKEDNQTGTPAAVNDSEELFVYFGALARPCCQSTGSQHASLDRCSSMSVNSSKNILAAQSAGKCVDLFRIRDWAEMKKKMKRRVKRVKAKQPGEDDNEDDDQEDQPEAAGEEIQVSVELQLSDVLEPTNTIRCTAKVRSFTFHPMPASGSEEDQGLLALTNNTLEMYRIPRGSGKNVEAPSKASIIDLQGHRSDIRGVAISNDGNNIATCSAESIKLWSSQSHRSTGSCNVEGYCISVAFAPGGRYVLTGSKDGKLHIFDSASGDCVYRNEDAHAGHAIWSITVRPDGRGFATGSADKTVKLWNFEVSAGGLKASLSRQLVLPSDVLFVRYSPTTDATRLMIAVCLLDNTLRIFYEDSLKLFLTLYGHKLPILCCDMSYDSSLIISGSADKTIKIWGMDFGDCHKSIFAHDDSVTCVQFLPNTHYFFSGGKDGLVKYYDADRGECILYLTGHKGCVWGLGIDKDGQSVYSVGQDRSMRVWKRNEDLVFIEEEKERMMEAQVDKAASQQDGAVSGIVDNNASSNSLVVGTTSSESIRGGEQLMVAIDLVEAELAALEEEKALQASKGQDSSSGKKKKGSSTPANPQLLGLTPYKYFQRQLKTIKGPDLEPALLTLPFHYVKKFIGLLVQLAKQGLDLELCCKCAVFLLLCHQRQLTATTVFLPDLLALKEIIHSSISGYRELIGTNQAGLTYMQRLMETEEEEKTALDTLLGMPKVATPKVGQELLGGEDSKGKKKTTKRKRN